MANFIPRKLIIIGSVVLAFYSQGLRYGCCSIQDQAIRELQSAENAKLGEFAVSDVIVRMAPEYIGADLRDPFQPFYVPVKVKNPSLEEGQSAKQQAKPLPTVEIQGIVSGALVPYAIVNGKVVKAGDIVDGLTIVEIVKDGIQVEYDRINYTLESPAIEALAK